MNKVPIKTYDEWEASYMDLDDFLGHPCRIDWALFNYFMGLPSVYVTQDYLQAGDPMDTNSEGVNLYMTVSTISNTHFYLGVLPEFKQE